MSPLERTTNAEIERVLDEAGAWYFKTWGSAQRAGLPDYIGCVDGRFVAVESKARGARRGVTALQRVVLDRIRRAGGIALEIRSGLELRDELARAGL